MTENYQIIGDNVLPPSTSKSTTKEIILENGEKAYATVQVADITYTHQKEASFKNVKVRAADVHYSGVIIDLNVNDTPTTHSIKDNPSTNDQNNQLLVYPTKDSDNLNNDKTSYYEQRYNIGGKYNAEFNVVSFTKTECAALIHELAHYAMDQMRRYIDHLKLFQNKGRLYYCCTYSFQNRLKHQAQPKQVVLLQ